MKVINSQVYSDPSRTHSNPYQRLLYSAIQSKYQMVAGTLEQAITQQVLTKRSLYHIHWEESLFSQCTRAAEAVRVRRHYVDQLRRYVSLGGKVVWTLHNIKPHERRFVQTLVSLRKDLARLSHRILVHNEAARATLQAQTSMTDMSKVCVLAHPTYFDIYEPADRSIELAGQPPTYPRTLLHFGLIRAYKGIPDLLRKLTQDFMRQHQLILHICGKPLHASSFLDRLLVQTEQRSDIQCSLNAVPVESVANLLRSHAGLIIPYHNVLTSGVAVLALTLGVLTVAPNTVAMREQFPESAHHLLFNPRSSKDLRRAVLALVNISAQTRMQIARDYIERALSFRPELVSKALGAIYDELLGPALCNESTLSRNRWPGALSDLAEQSRVTSLFQWISENKVMATRVSKNAAAALSNQQLALELVKATLVGSVRPGISDELILNSVQDANKLVVERARLDGGYTVRLYTDILSRLDRQLPEGGEK